MAPTHLQTAADAILLGFINLSDDPGAMQLHHFLGLAATFGQIHQAAMQDDKQRVLELLGWATYRVEEMRSDLRADWLGSIEVLRLAAMDTPAERLPWWARSGPDNPMSVGVGPLPIRVYVNTMETKKPDLRLVTSC